MEVPSSEETLWKKKEEKKRYQCKNGDEESKTKYKELRFSFA